MVRHHEPAYPGRNRFSFPNLRRADRRPTLRPCLAPTRCADCYANTTPCTVRRRRRQSCPTHHGWELYMVRDEVWAAAGAPPSPPKTPDNFFLCVGCLEQRLGRILTPADFSDLPINDCNPVDSDRLLDRKGFR